MVEHNVTKKSSMKFISRGRIEERALANVNCPPPRLFSQGIMFLSPWCHGNKIEMWKHKFQFLPLTTGKCGSLF